MSIHKKLIKWLQDSGFEHHIILHESAGLSADVALARKKVGITEAEGAKALLIKSKKFDQFINVVVPASSRLNKSKLKLELGRTRFAKDDEFFELTEGLGKGMLPPFTEPFFPNIGKLFVDQSLFDFQSIAFNAACLDKSIMMPSENYKALVCSNAKIVNVV